MKSIGIIGCGRIGGPVIRAIQAGQIEGFSLLSVLTQNLRQLENIETVVDPDAFFDQQFDLIIDTAGPSSMIEHGARALRNADLWTVNAAALADAGLYNQLEATGREYGNRLRVLSGAIAGLDGVATLSIDGDAEVLTTVDVMPSEKGRGTLFKGGVREAAKLFPESINVAVATALASTAIDDVQIEVVQPDLKGPRSLTIKAQSQYGYLEVKTIPNVIPDKGIHTVAACIVAALRQENKVIWIG
jgi:aspartate dehydrogenase